MKTIGVIGGMGPDATLAFLNQVVAFSQKHPSAKPEVTPRIIADILSFENGIVETLKYAETAVPILTTAARGLEEAGADFLVMPCNSAHAYAGQIREAVNIPLLHIGEVTAERIVADGHKTVGLVATTTTLKNRIYEGLLQQYGISILLTTRQEDVTRILGNVISGRRLEEDRGELVGIIREMEQKGAQAIIAGCTEVPLLVKQGDIPRRLYDTDELLARAAVNFAYS
ncbi:amino acid racemase [Candidatus Woesearchaeota archaeon]|nr:amino acid racemase [Candidatus Woesearchaeota archaeon]